MEHHLERPFVSPRPWRRASTRLGALLAASMLSLLMLPSALAEDVESKNQECFDCHDGDDTKLSFGDGSFVEVNVDPEAWKGSVHGTELTCRDCHRQITDHPHPEVKFPNAREYRIDRSETCKRCHYAYHTRMLDSIHYKQLADGNRSAPTCVDCHGAHAVTDPKTPRTSVDKRCEKCHEAITVAYRGSVHGKALQGEQGDDVPVCTDCHGAHAIRDPRLPEFHASSYQICGKCHADEDKMERHGLNPNVLTSYLEDFHGRSNQLYAMGAGKPGQPIATCTDCHGVHDIQSFQSGGATAAEVRERVVTACRKCHEGAPPAFADAWLSHYEPTLSSAPLVWAIQWTYRILIPLIMVGLVLHILLHLWRVRTHR